jgi:hypothetical protein
MNVSEYTAKRTEGFFLNESSVDYHATDAVSSSKLADMRIAGELCPLNYYVRHVAKTVEAKKGAHFSLGIATHLAILEGEAAFDAGCVMEPPTYTNEKGEVKPWNNNANVCKAWYAGAAGRIVLDRKEAELIRNMAIAVAKHSEAFTLTHYGTPEVTFRKQIAGLTLQCRVDKWHPDGVKFGKDAHAKDIDGPVVVDLKTCNTIEQFEREFYFLRYNFRAEFYRLVTAEVLAEMAGQSVESIPAPAFRFVVVEKSAPYRVRVYEPDAESLAAGRAEVHADLITLRSCQATGVWPSNTSGTKSIGLKTWQLAKSDAANEQAFAAA